jgi:hypothetical protein
VDDHLGPQAKVATAMHANGKDHVICVYTYDHNDESDVRRVRQALRDLGFTAKIPYKTDEATLGEKKQSKYFE